jgi:hypothetical protein
MTQQALPKSAIWYVSSLLASTVQIFKDINHDL